MCGVVLPIHHPVAVVVLAVVAVPLRRPFAAARVDREVSVVAVTAGGTVGEAAGDGAVAEAICVGVGAGGEERAGRTRRSLEALSPSGPSGPDGPVGPWPLQTWRACRALWTLRAGRSGEPRFALWPSRAFRNNIKNARESRDLHVAHSVRAPWLGVRLSTQTYTNKEPVVASISYGPHAGLMNCVM